MSLEVIEPKIWSFPIDGSHPQIQPFTLTKLMYGIPDHPNYLVRRGSCLVMGVSSMPQSAAEFDNMIKQEVDKAVQKYHSTNPDTQLRDEQINRLACILRENYCGHHTNPFRVFRYVDGKGKSMADGLPYQGIMTDMDWLAILYFDTRDITILPYGDPRGGPHSKLFYDARAKIAASRWGYDGNLGTALSEFSQRGFAFNLAKLPSILEGRQQWLDTAGAQTRITHGTITDTNLSLGQVLSVISHTPVL